MWWCHRTFDMLTLWCHSALLTRSSSPISSVRPTITLFHLHLHLQPTAPTHLKIPLSRQPFNRPNVQQSLHNMSPITYNAIQANPFKGKEHPLPPLHLLLTQTRPLPSLRSLHPRARGLHRLPKTVPPPRLNSLPPQRYIPRTRRTSDHGCHCGNPCV